MTSSGGGTCPRTDSWTTTQIFDNWTTRTRILTPGDVTGDALPDLLSVDSAGALWIYPGKGTGSFGTRVKVGTGWNSTTRCSVTATSPATARPT